MENQLTSKAMRGLQLHVNRKIAVKDFPQWVNSRKCERIKKYLICFKDKGLMKQDSFTRFILLLFWLLS